MSNTPDASPEIVTAALLVIGDEILSGRTHDKNIAAVASRMSALGIQLREVRVVADDEAAIVAAVNALRTNVTYLFTTGGIGPTHDDITADCIAKALGLSIDIDPRAVALMEPHYCARGLELTPARLRMARIPAGATLIRNAVSAAPGFMVGNVVVMAGVPVVAQAMLDDVEKHLRTGARTMSETISLARPESEIAELYRDLQARHPAVTMGSYPGWRPGGGFGTELVLRSTDAAALAAARAALEAELAARKLV